MSHTKKSHATVFVSGLGSDICNPFFDRNGTLHVIRQSMGSILTIDSVGNPSPIINTGGQPSYATFNTEDILYVTDFGHSAVLAYTREGQQELVVGVYEDKPLKGPNSICMVDGDIFFTDSGAFGETGLHAPTGSVFSISSSPSGQVLKPIAINSLAYPSGIAVTKNKKFIYVAETMNNRILRFFQQPVGVYHGSVFYNLTGGVGPVSLCLDDNGNLYIGVYEVKEGSSEGSVLMLSGSGKLLRTITTAGAEVSGVAISDSCLYITEKSTGSILKFDL
jgi:sugar lactone lactonase YvrE